MDPIKQTARSALSDIARIFEDPAVKADYERWLAERQEQDGKKGEVAVCQINGK